MRGVSPQGSPGGAGGGRGRRRRRGRVGAHEGDGRVPPCWEDRPGQVEELRLLGKEQGVVIG